MCESLSQRTLAEALHVVRGAIDLLPRGFHSSGTFIKHWMQLFYHDTHLQTSTGTFCELVSGQFCPFGQFLL